MILPFKTRFKNGSPTHFVAKIWNSLILLENYNELLLWASENGFISEINPELAPKPHTIREDKNNRWRAGRLIHFTINNRTKNSKQFAPVMVCKSTQDIVIVYDDEESRPYIYVDGHELTEEDHELLAKNDGFDTVWDLYAWFDHDFTGKIIHWTTLKY